MSVGRVGREDLSGARRGQNSGDDGGYNKPSVLTDRHQVALMTAES